jgi:hypothetical protein
MSKSFNKIVAPDSYGFTTTKDDTYIFRVVDEAKPNVNIILLHDHNTETGTQGVILLVRKSFLQLAEKFPDLLLADKFLDEWTSLDTVDVHTCSTCGNPIKVNDNVELANTHDWIHTNGFWSCLIGVKNYDLDVKNYDLGVKNYDLGKLYTANINGEENAAESDKVTTNDFIVYPIEGSAHNYQKVVNHLHQQIKRIQNAVEGRTIKVTVESFS